MSRPIATIGVAACLPRAGLRPAPSPSFLIVEQEFIEPDRRRRRDRGRTSPSNESSPRGSREARPVPRRRAGRRARRAGPMNPQIRLESRSIITRRSALPPTCRTGPHDLDPRLAARVSAYRPLRRLLNLGIDVVGVIAGHQGSSQIRKTCPSSFLRERRDRFSNVRQDGWGS